MSRSLFRLLFVLAVLVLAVIALATNGGAPAMAEEAAAGAIHIEYVPPKNPDHQRIYDLLRERGALEKVKAIFDAFRLPRDVTVQTIGCDGDADAWYELVDGRPTVTLCYEYLQQIWDRLPKQSTEAGITRADALAGQFFFAVAHEFGHLSFSVYKAPILGHAEDAADNFAAFIMLQFRADARRLITGAAWSYQAFVKNYKQNPTATLPLAAFSSNHGQPEERFFNLLCVAYGSNNQLYADFVDKGYLPRSRAIHCKNEFGILQFALRQLIVPHIDQKKAAEVLATEWLTDVVAAPPVPEH